MPRLSLPRRIEPASSLSAGCGSAANGSGRVDFDGRKAEPGGQQAVEHAFAEPGGQFGRHTMADHLLDQAVSRRHPAGDGEMRHGLPHQLDEAERAGTAAIEQREPAHQIKCGHQHEGHRDGGARADGGHHRHPLHRAGHQAAGFVIERRHQLALGEAHQIRAVDDIGQMRLQPGAWTRQLRQALGEDDEVAAERAAGGAVIAHQNGRRAPACRVDGGKPGEAQHFPGHHHGQRDHRGGRQGGADAAKPSRTGEQVRDQVGHAEPGGKQQQARRRGPKYRGPRHARARADGMAETAVPSTTDLAVAFPAGRRASTAGRTTIAGSSSRNTSGLWARFMRPAF